MGFDDFEINEEMEEACRLGDLRDHGEDPDIEDFDPRDLDHPGDE